jgi:hypothetical protein
MSTETPSTPFPTTTSLPSRTPFPILGGVYFKKMKKGDSFAVEMLETRLKIHHPLLCAPARLFFWTRKSFLDTTQVPLDTQKSFLDQPAIP